jgi:hypothetical protein
MPFLVLSSLVWFYIYVSNDYFVVSHSISEEGVKKFLSNVNPKNANGPDNIPNRDCATNIAPYVTIYQKSYELGSVTDDWIMAVITALLKKRDKKLPGNYRPVSLTSVTCKLMEHIIFKHIMQNIMRYANI